MQGLTEDYHMLTYECGSALFQESHGKSDSSIQIHPPSVSADAECSSHQILIGLCQTLKFLCVAYRLQNNGRR